MEATQANYLSLLQFGTGFKTVLRIPSFGTLKTLSTLSPDQKTWLTQRILKQSFFVGSLSAIFRSLSGQLGAKPRKSLKRSGVAPANQTKERAETKSSWISPIFVNSCVFLRKTSTIHIELLFRSAPAKSSWTDLSLVWFAGATPEKSLTGVEPGPSESLEEVSEQSFGTFSRLSRYFWDFFPGPGMLSSDFFGVSGPKGFLRVWSSYRHPEPQNSQSDYFFRLTVSGRLFFSHFSLMKYVW